MPYNASQHEKDILEFWDKERIFERSIEEGPKDNPYTFYDGPPFATGLPHYGHLVASTMKDAVPRYFTMQGYRVERRWGWDCHGLPIENLIEKELNLPGKKEIEDFGIDKFNEAARSKVLMYADEWKTTIKRLGRWVDMEHDYKTMDIEFMESVWWVFQSLWNSGLVYEGKKAMHICPRCATPLSNFEVTQGYKDIKDLSVVAKFLVTSEVPIEGRDSTLPLYFLAWTTTPWTLPGNILLAVGADIHYAVVRSEGAYYIVAHELVMTHFEGKSFEVVGDIYGKDLVGASYEPLFPYFAHIDGAEKGFRVVSADFVSTEEGTGVVHIAPAFGDDDYEVFKQHGVPFIQHVTIDGRFVAEVTEFAGMEVKKKDDHMATDIEIVKWLSHHDRLFSKKKYDHSYPHCWRCDTPLLNYATSSWFVAVTQLKQLLLENNQQIQWIPESMKEGRFGQWLEGARDWAVSRSRYWGTPLPVWKSDDGEVLCLGSVAELEALSGKKVTDLHKHFVDPIEIEKDGKMYRRIPEVFDCWFESGSMPYGQMHYPFENKELFEQGFPAQFIAEGQDQTRGWFYTLHVLATALTSGKHPAIPFAKSVPAFTNVIVNGLVLAEDGKKMSKRLQNYPDPNEVLEKYGADSLRFYLLTSPVMHAEKLNFSEAGVRELFNKTVNSVANVLSFYEMYAVEATASGVVSTHVLDQWIVARLQELVRDVTSGMNSYKLAEASRPIIDFISDLSQWYVRRSRDRFKSDDLADKQAAITTLQEVLRELAKVMAPFMPFIAEKVYQTVGGTQTSVHLERWPAVNTVALDHDVLAHMSETRQVVEYALSLRKDAGVKVRQPLSLLEIQGLVLDAAYCAIIADEVNVKEVTTVQELQQASDVVVKEDQGIVVALHTTVDARLQQEGILRELVRGVNLLRKEHKLTIDDRAKILFRTEDLLIRSVIQDLSAELLKATASVSVEEGDTTEELTINDTVVYLGIEKIG